MFNLLVALFNPETLVCGEACTVEFLYEAIHSGNWALVLSVGLMVLVFVARKSGLLKHVPQEFVPWLAAAIGVVSYVALALQVPGVAIGNAIVSGVVAGAGAVGLWELVGKAMFGAPVKVETSDPGLPEDEGAPEEAPEEDTKPEEVPAEGEKSESEDSSEDPESGKD